MSKIGKGIFLLAAFAGITGLAPRASADEVVVVTAQPAPQERRTERPERSYSYNPWMLHSGVVILGLSYGTSVIVAMESSHDGDKNLWIPVAGPWLDLANRSPSCPVGRSGCGGETFNKVLLVADGVFQAVGTLDIIGALFMRPRDVDSRRAYDGKPHLVAVAPWVTSTTYGLSAGAIF